MNTVSQKIPPIANSSITPTVRARTKQDPCETERRTRPCEIHEAAAYCASNGAYSTAPSNDGIISSTPLAPSPFPALMTSLRRPRVFLLAQPSVSRRGELPDLRPLGEFGDVTVIVTGDMNPMRYPARTATAIEDKLHDFDPEVDYLVAAGGATLAALVIGLVLGQMGIEQFQWLSFQRGIDAEGRRVNEGGYYRPVRLDFGQIELLEDEAGDPNEEDTDEQ